MAKSKGPKPNKMKGKLYDLLDETFPQYRTRDGRLSIRRISVALDLSTQAVMGWCVRDRLPSERVKDLIRLSKDELTLEDLAPYFT